MCFSHFLTLSLSLSLFALLFSILQVTLFATLSLSLSLFPSKSDFGPVELQQNSGIEV